MPKQNSSAFIGPAKIANKIFDRIANGVIDAGGSDEDLRRIETDDDLVAKIAQLIAGAKQAVVHVFETWKTVKVGTFQSVNDIKAVFEAVGMRLGNWAGGIFGKGTFPAESETVSFVRVRVSDLGFIKQTKLRDILAEGQRCGLKLCLPEDGPAIRLGYSDQPMYEVVWLAMEPVQDSEGFWSALSVHRGDNGLWLDTHCHVLVDVWAPESEFFFRKPA